MVGYVGGVVVVLIVIGVIIGSNQNDGSARQEARVQPQVNTVQSTPDQPAVITEEQTDAQESSPPTPEPPTPTPPPDPNRGIQFGNPITFETGGFKTVGVLATNTTDQVKSFTVKVTYKNGDQILATAIGAVNDLLPNQVRAVSLVSQEDLPTTYETARVDVDTMIREAQTTENAAAARKIAFGPPAVSDNAGFVTVNVEVTNHDDVLHSFTVQAIFQQAGELVGIGSGAVNDLAPGQTKTASLIVQGTVADADIQLAVDTVVR